MRNKYIRKNNRDKMILRNLGTSLILYEKVKTTLFRAKTIKPIIDKMISAGQKKNISGQKKMVKFFTDPNAIKKINEDLVERFGKRKSGFCTMVRIGYRSGDAAPMVLLELALPKKIEKEKEAIEDKKTTKITVKTKDEKKKTDEATPKKSWVNKISDVALGKNTQKTTKKTIIKRTTSK